MRYECPATVDDAVQLLSGASGITRILAGGTDVLVEMNSGNIEPELIVDIKRLPNMYEIVSENGAFRIGAAVPCALLCEHDGLKAAWPGVVEAAGLIGSTQIQGRATIAGNICNASPAADCLPPLLAAGAILRVVGPNGRSEINTADLLVGPGKTSLAKSQFVESIVLPARPPRSADAYQRFIPRTEMDIAVVGVAVTVTLDDSGICTEARLALGAVAETAILVPEASDVMVGVSLGGLDFDKLSSTASAACRPIDDKRGTIEFRTQVAGVLAKRVAKEAFERAVKKP